MAKVDLGAIQPNITNYISETDEKTTNIQSKENIIITFSLSRSNFSDIYVGVVVNKNDISVCSVDISGTTLSVTLYNSSGNTQDVTVTTNITYYMTG